MKKRLLNQEMVKRKKLIENVVHDNVQWMMENAAERSLMRRKDAANNKEN
jgi:hypothetical protein